MDFMCVWAWIGTGIGALIGYLLGVSLNKSRVKTLTEENATLSLKVSELAREINGVSHYRDKLSNIKDVVNEFTTPKG